MYSIVICDDDIGCCSQIKKWIYEFSLNEKVDLKIDIFSNVEDLYQQMMDGKKVNLIFQDIELPGLNGVEMGILIREVMKNDKTSIVFISGKTQYCIQLFDVQPINFHHKPLYKEDIIRDIRIGMKQAREFGEIFYFCEDGIENGIPLGDILYFEAKDKRTLITIMEDAYEIRRSLDEIIEKVKDFYFARCHRSYIINLAKVENYGADQFEMVDQSFIPLGRKYKSEIKRIQMKRGIGENYV